MGRCPTISGNVFKGQGRSRPRCQFINNRDALEGRLRIAVPNKGRLRAPALRLLEDSGIGPIYDPGSRSLVTPTNMDDVYIVYVRAEDIPGVVAAGAADLGITGHDLVVESDAKVDELLDLGFGRARLVLAVPEGSGISSISDLRPGMRVATKFVRIAGEFFRGLGLDVEIVRISGAAEVMPMLGAADAIVDVTSTGTTLALHGLKPIHTIMESSARLIGGPSRAARRELADRVVESVRSVIMAKRRKLLLMNVPDESLSDVLSVLPAMSGPMVAKVQSSSPMWEVMAAVPAEEIPRLIVELRRRGARDLLAIDLERLMPRWT